MQELENLAVTFCLDIDGVACIPSARCPSDSLQVSGSIAVPGTGGDKVIPLTKSITVGGNISFIGQRCDTVCSVGRKDSIFLGTPPDK